MLGWNRLDEMKRDRGPRHLVYGTIRRDEFEAAYATSAAQAEELEARMRAAGRRNVRVLAPGTADDDHAEVLRSAAMMWRVARDAEIDLRQQLTAAVVTAVGQGMAESEAARRAGVDRMTVRKWAGKR